MRFALVLLIGLVLVLPVAAQQEPTKPVLVLDSGGHTAAVTRVLFTPDDRQVVTVSEDKTVRVWDVASGETVRVLRLPIGSGSAGELACAALSPKGRLLAVAGEGLKGNEGAIYLIVLATGRIERILKGHSETVRTLAFSPDGNWLASGSNDRTVRLWDAVTGRARPPLSGDKRHVVGLAFSPDSKRLVSVTYGPTARLWDVATGQSVATLSTPENGRAVAWSPDGKTIAIVSASGVLGLWNADGTFRKQLALSSSQIRSLDFTRDSRALLLAGGRCGIYDLDGKERVKFTRHTPLLVNLVNGALSHRNQLAVTAGQGDEVFLWRTADAAVVRRLGGQGRTGWSVGWSPDSQTLAWGNTRKRTGTLTTRNRPLEHTFSLAELQVGGAAPDTYRRAVDSLGEMVVEQGDAKGVKIKQGMTILTFAKIGRVRCATLLPGDRAAVGGSGLVLFDLRTGKKLREYRGANEVYAVAPSPDGRYLLTASDNQALSVWTLDRDDPLLSLFVAGREWIAWTPEGYYASSPGGERLMGWHVNNGPDQLATFHPAARFRSSLYRPDVIKRLLRSGSLTRALQTADKLRGQTTRLVQVAEVLPPTVVVTAPDQAAVTVNEPSLEVRAIAQAVGNHPITALRLLLDGRPYGGDKGLKKIAKPAAGPVRESWKITLAPGTHRVAVQAESAVSKGLSEAVQVTFAARGLKPVPESPEKKRAELPALYMLAIGISAYPGDLKLQCAARDAQVLAKTIQARARDLYREVKVEVLTDKDATRLNILTKLSDLTRRMTQRDVAIVSFAGHGDRDAHGRFFLMPVDANPSNLLASCVDGEQVKSVLADMPGRVVMLLDACHSGAVGREGKRARAALTDDLVRDLTSDDYGVVVMCSSMGREYSLESAKEGHGYFTLALVEGLRGKAANSDGVVYLHQLDAWVTDRVRTLSKGQQHPVTTRPTSIRSFPLTK